MKKINFFYIFVLLLFSALVPKVLAVQTPTASVPATSLFSFKKLILSVKDQKETIPEEQLRNFVSIEPTLKISLKEKSEIENIHYCPSSLVLCSLLSNQRQMLMLRKETRTSANEEEIKDFLDALSEKFDKDPIDAKFQIGENGIIDFANSQEGIAIDIPKSIEVLSANLTSDEASEETKEISLPYDITEPKIKSSEANNLGINTIIGEGSSNFRGSPKNRIFNINVATEKFNGILIKPDEEFSFVKTLGEVDGEHGYAPELVIKKDKTEPEFGGGICQVSTTAFRAAINSGLKITLRRNHAYPVAYYNPQGMDATVYIPWPDLRFINNTPNNILIQTKIEGTVLKFQFFGTSDERKVEIIGPKILERNPDGSMKTTFTQKVYDKDGNSIIDDVFNSSYDSPSKYPHPGEEKLTTKPSGWSSKEWKKYKQTNDI
ncbi:MAG: VanW family protein [Parcubacteria group bacterium]|jgi:vancomycin resistance protein YoaR